MHQRSPIVFVIRENFKITFSCFFNKSTELLTVARILFSIFSKEFSKLDNFEHKSAL